MGFEASKMKITKELEQLEEDYPKYENYNWDKPYIKHMSPVSSSSPLEEKKGPILIETKKHLDRIFEWNEKAEQVFLTGSFTNWTSHYLMEKNNDKHCYSLKLEKGKYYYKYIVDGEWMYRNDKPIEVDSFGNVNNVIEISQIKNDDWAFVFEEEKNLFDVLVLSLLKKENGANVNNLLEQEKFHKESYSNASDFEERKRSNDFFDDNSRERPKKKGPPMVPLHLSEINYVSENENQHKLIWANSLENEEEIENYWIIKKFDMKAHLKIPFHVTINHFGLLDSTYRNGGYDTYVLTQRYKSKYITTKYFTSKYSNKIYK